LGTKTALIRQFFSRKARRGFRGRWGTFYQGGPAGGGETVRDPFFLVGLEGKKKDKQFGKKNFRVPAVIRPLSAGGDPDILQKRPKQKSSFFGKDNCFFFPGRAKLVGGPGYRSKGT